MWPCGHGNFNFCIGSKTTFTDQENSGSGCCTSLWCADLALAHALWKLALCQMDKHECRYVSVWRMYAGTYVINAQWNWHLEWNDVYALCANRFYQIYVNKHFSGVGLNPRDLHISFALLPCMCCTNIRNPSKLKGHAWAWIPLWYLLPILLIYNANVYTHLISLLFESHRPSRFLSCPGLQLLKSHRVYWTFLLKTKSIIDKALFGLNWYGVHSLYLRTFARKSSNIDNFIKLLLLIANELLVSELQK